MGTRDWTRAEWKLSGSLTPKLADQGEDKPLEEAVTSYLADCRARGLEPSTVLSYENTLRSFVVHCGQNHCFGTAGVSVDLVTGFRSGRPGKTQKSHVADCPAKLKRAGRRNCDCPIVTAAPSGKTLRKELETLRGFCRYCKDRDWMRKNPAAVVKQVKDDTPGALPFEQAEIETILKACESFDRNERNTLRAKGLVLLLLYSGFRISDAAIFKRASLNIETL